MDITINGGSGGTGGAGLDDGIGGAGGVGEGPQVTMVHTLNQTSFQRCEHIFRSSFKALCKLMTTHHSSTAFSATRAEVDIAQVVFNNVFNITGSVTVNYNQPLRGRGAANWHTTTDEEPQPFVVRVEQEKVEYETSRRRAGDSFASSARSLWSFTSDPGRLSFPALFSKAPTPVGVHSHEFIFLPPALIVHRGMELRDYIIITLQPSNLNLTDERPEPGFTFKGLSRHELVVWKGRRKGPVTVRLPANLGFGDVREKLENKGIISKDLLFSFAPLRTLVKREDGTFHKTRSDADFSPFLLIPNVQPGDFCIASQSADLRVNAYIAQNSRERQRLNSDLFGVSDASEFIILDGSTVAAQLSEEDEALEAVPGPYPEDEEVEYAPKILSPPLLGENGTLVSSLDQTTRWCLVKESGVLKLKTVPLVWV
ncbi:hypothetical protein C8R45DRAFT_1041532 [Mycena sanguinolenta]|nr:hypothetical protein C8R45DRAFT_1041532 [Mycena sanguinolenta]